MIWLNADAKHSALSHGVTAACDVADPGGCEHQIFVAHQLGYGGGDFRDDRLLQGLELSLGGSIIEQELAKVAYRHAGNGTEAGLVEGIEDEARDIVMGGVDERAAHDFVQGRVG